MFSPPHIFPRTLLRVCVADLQFIVLSLIVLLCCPPPIGHAHHDTQDEHDGVCRICDAGHSTRLPPHILEVSIAKVERWKTIGGKHLDRIYHRFSQTNIFGSIFATRGTVSYYIVHSDLGLRTSRLLEGGGFGVGEHTTHTVLAQFTTDHLSPDMKT